MEYYMLNESTVTVYLQIIQVICLQAWVYFMSMSMCFIALYYYIAIFMNIENLFFENEE